MEIIDFEELLKNGTGGVYGTPTKDSSVNFVNLVHSVGYSYFYLDGSGTSSKVSYLSALYHTLSFPDWCGLNWDACWDCIIDLEWVENIGRGPVLLYDNIEVFAASEFEQFQIAIDILHKATQQWRVRRNRPFFVILKGDWNTITNPLGGLTLIDT